MNLRYPPIQRLSIERARKLAADPARRRLLEQLSSAITRDEIDAGRLAQHAWLVANPDDFGVLQAGEDLAYAEEGLEALEAAAMPQAEPAGVPRPMDRGVSQ